MSQIFSINLNDLKKGLVVAILSGAVLPVLAMIQTPGFDISTANWNAVLVLAINGAITGFASYIAKNFVSDDSGRVLGKF